MNSFVVLAVLSVLGATALFVALALFLRAIDRVLGTSVARPAVLDAGGVEIRLGSSDRETDRRSARRDQAVPASGDPGVSRRSTPIWPA
jgi:hypothetical protein